MNRSRALIALFVLLVSPCAARADIAPPPVHVTGSVVPRSHLDVQGQPTAVFFRPLQQPDFSEWCSDPESVEYGWIQEECEREHEGLRKWTALYGAGGGPDLDAPVDVTLVSQRVTLDVLPTLVHVRAEYELRAGESGAKNLAIGLAEALPDVPLALPLEDLSVALDGEPIAVERVTAVVAPGEVARLVDEQDPMVGAPPRTFTGASRWGGPSSWYTWTMSAAPDQTRSLVVEYNQVFADHYTVLPSEDYPSASPTLFHLLSAGRTWKGTVETTELLLRLHGLDLDDVQVEGLPPATEAGETHELWRIEQVEPNEMVRLQVRREADLFAFPGLGEGLALGQDLSTEIDLLHRYVLLVSSLQAHTTEFGRMDNWVAENDLLAWEALLSDLEATVEKRRAEPRDRAMAERLLEEMATEMAACGRETAARSEEGPAWGSTSIVQRQRRATCWRCQDEDNTCRVLQLTAARVESKRRPDRSLSAVGVALLPALLGLGWLGRRLRRASRQSGRTPPSSRA
jgi:hypothetical protein